MEPMAAEISPVIQRTMEMARQAQRDLRRESAAAAPEQDRARQAQLRQAQRQGRGPSLGR
jgi:hypothetical protein